MIGRNCRSSRSVRVVPAARKALVVALSLSLITGGVPAPAWAQALEDELDVPVQAAPVASEAQGSRVDALIGEGVGEAPASEKSSGEVLAPEEGAGGESAAPASEPAEALSETAAPASEPVEAVSDGAGISAVSDAGPAESEAKLAAAVEALEKDGFSGYRPVPKFGVDANLNTMIEARLAELGVAGVTSHVVSSGMEKYEPAARGSIDISDGASNGDIEFFFLPPAERAGNTDYTLLRRFQPTYRLSCGDATVTFTPGRTSQLPWDDARVEEYLSQMFATVELPSEIAQGSVPAETAELELPRKVVDAKTGKTVASIEWASSNSTVARVTMSYDAASVRFTHRAAPADAVLTATLKMAGASGLSDAQASVDHRLAVAPRPGATNEQIERELSSMLAKAEVSQMEGALDPAAVSGDLKLPSPRALGVDGRVYKLAYESSDPAAIRVNGYRGVVTPNLEGEEPRFATITASLTYEGVTVRRDLGTFTPSVVTNAEIDAAVAFMGQVKAGYAAALLGANASAGQVEKDLAPFQSASPAADGSIAWARTAAERDDAGVVPVDLPGYDPMGTAKWRLFRSSREAVVASESLLVTRPEYNTKTRVDSRLTYKAYESLAKAHPGDARLQKLVDQPVSAIFTVLGTAGAEDPDSGRMLTVNARVIGLDAAGDDGTRMQRDWVPLTEVALSAEDGATAWDVFAGLLDEAGYTYALNAGGPTSITAPNGTTLDSDFSDPYRYWAFFIDGEYGQGEQGASTTCRVKDGMTIELRYLDYGATVVPQVDVPVNPDAEHPHLDAQWNGFINGGAGAVTGAQTPVADGELAWAENLLTPEEVKAGGKLYASDPLIIDGKVYIVTASEVQDPVTWRPVHSISRLQVVDRATGKVEREVALGATMDSTCRPAYADGIIVIPLSGGRLQAVSAKTLETLWVVPASSKGQSLCTLTVRDGYVYVSSFDSFGDGESTASGSVKRYSLRTGALAGDIRNDRAGYYWAGGVSVGDFFVIGDDAGVIHVFTSDLSREVSSMDVSDHFIRTSLVEADGFVYAVSRNDGVLHKLAIDGEGAVREVGRVQVAAYSTSTPAIVGTYAFVGGLGEGKMWLAPGVLSVVDLSSMTVVASITKADGSDIRGEIKGAPLVSVQDGETYVYFTSNKVSPSFDEGGGVYVYRLGDAQASVLFQPGPGQIQYCMASVICDEEGNLYYTNDSGHLFKIAGHGPAQGGDGGDGGDSGEQGGGGGQGGNQGGDGDGESQGGDTGQGGGQAGNGGEQAGSGDDSLGGQTGSGGVPEPEGAHTPGVGGGASAVPPASRPAAGSVAAGAKPVSAVEGGRSASSAPGEGSPDEPREGGPAQVGVVAGAGSALVNVAEGSPLPARIAFAAGAAGAVGLVVSGAWMAVSRRRKGM